MHKEVNTSGNQADNWNGLVELSWAGLNNYRFNAKQLREKLKNYVNNAGALIFQ